MNFVLHQEHLGDAYLGTGKILNSKHLVDLNFHLKLPRPTGLLKILNIDDVNRMKPTMHLDADFLSHFLHYLIPNAVRNLPILVFPRILQRGEIILHLSSQSKSYMLKAIRISWREFHFKPLIFNIQG